eukprot:TRINITY_DN3165_c0_g1_i1.p1 TRINITY_DN3165_c0_g1~~TRINITY_DN3165_c0_g1_i1.p1  ORF type:complete len:384 (+),score=43.47 TRINITY_DN3165_c0_g1_i1:170-1321(+)
MWSDFYYDGRLQRWVSAATGEDDAPQEEKLARAGGGGEPRQEGERKRKRCLDDDPWRHAAWRRGPAASLQQRHRGICAAAAAAAAGRPQQRRNALRVKAGNRNGGSGGPTQRRERGRPGRSGGAVIDVDAAGAAGGRSLQEVTVIDVDDSDGVEVIDVDGAGHILDADAGGAVLGVQGDDVRVGSHAPRVPTTPPPSPPACAEEKERCPICVDVQRPPFGVLKCSHSFCFRCITAWSRTSTLCPICRKRFHSIKKVSATGKQLRVVRVKKTDFEYEESVGSGDYASSDEDGQYQACRYCGTNDDHAMLFLCDYPGCEHRQHSYCCQPCVDEPPEDGDFYCTECTDAHGFPCQYTTRDARINPTRWTGPRTAAGSPPKVSQEDR